jgi:YHS domain-containing protein
MKSILSAGMVLVGVGLLAACETGPRTVAAGHAECLVCKVNADLACVDVTVKGDTPRAEYLGKTYYFCSNECRDKFVKEPAKYVAVADK